MASSAFFLTCSTLASSAPGRGLLAILRAMLLGIGLFGVLFWVLFGTTGCIHFGGPKETPQEKAILHFEVEGIALGSHPSKLTRFPQLQALAETPAHEAVFMVFNPNSFISMAIFTYQKESLVRVEMRYLQATGLDSLENAGGWEGIMHYLIDHYGPPSDAGPHVPLVATMPGLEPSLANFNGEWVFSRVHRQMNYIAQITPVSGMAAITIQDTQPTKPKKKPKKRDALPKPPEQHSLPYPGF